MTFPPKLALLAAIPLVGLCSVQGYRYQTDPEAFLGGGARWAWLVAPTSAAYEAATDRRIEQALAALNDTGRPPAERIAAYRAELGAAAGLLHGSLAAEPAQAKALSQLAAIVWELAPPVSEPAIRAQLERIDRASRLAPRVPAVQLRLGELLLRMGRRGEAPDYLRRAVELDPTFAGRVVRLCGQHLFSADEITTLLPHSVETLSALQVPYLGEGRAADYLALLDGAEAASQPALLAAYGQASLHLGDSTRLLERMDRLGPLEAAACEAERLRQRSRALSDLSRHAEASVDARRASALAPADAGYAEHLGRMALAAGEADEAARAFTRALALIVRRSDDPRGRARLYALIGRAAERQGRPEGAYDAYRRALALDPAEPHARARVAAMERAAGLGPDGG